MTSGDLRPCAVVEAEGLRLRRVEERDVPYLVALAGEAEVERCLAPVSPWSEEDLRESLARGEAEPAAEGRFVLEAWRGGAWAPAGGLAFAVQNRRSRIAQVSGVMVDPAFRGRGLAVRAIRALALHLLRDLGCHRVQLEAYGFNERGHRVFERAGFVREGVRRRAYFRHGEWQDGVMFGLVEEDLGR